MLHGISGDLGKAFHVDGLALGVIQSRTLRLGQLDGDRDLCAAVRGNRDAVPG